jgi:hypothetical protein
MLIPMRIIKRVLIVSCVIPIIFLAGGCGNVTPLPTVTEMAVSNLISTTPSSIPLPIPTITLSPQITIQFTITATSEQIARWKEYEQALASKLLSHLPPEEVLCEWEILGETERDVYVWAVCIGLPPTGRGDEYAPSASIPAVVHLNPDMSIHTVELPRDNHASYVDGIQKLFPENVKKRMFERSTKISDMIAHIKLRRKNPEPPLNIQLSTP